MRDYFGKDMEIGGVSCTILYYPKERMKSFDAAEERLLRDFGGYVDIEDLKYCQYVKKASREDIRNYGSNKIGIVCYKSIEMSYQPYSPKAWHEEGYIITAISPTGEQTLYVVGAIQLAIAPPTKTAKSYIYKVEREKCVIERVEFSRPSIYQSLLILIKEIEE